MARKSRIKIAVVGMISSILICPVAIAFPRIQFEHPQSPEEFIGAAKARFNPEIRAFGTALAGILVLHLLIKR